MSKIYEIAFEIAGRLDSNFKGAFSGASAQLQALGSHSQKLKGDMRDLERSQRQAAKEVENSAKAYTELRGSYSQSVQTLLQLNQKITSTKAALKALSEEKKAGTITAKEFSTRNAELVKQLKTANAAYGELKPKVQSIKTEMQKLAEVEQQGKLKVDQYAEAHSKLASELERTAGAHKRLAQAEQQQSRLKDQNSQIKDKAISTAAMAAPFVGATMAAVTYEDAQKRVQIQAGLTAQESAAAFNVVRQAYLSGLGEDVQAVSNAYGQMSEIVKGESSEQQKAILQGALAIEKYFGAGTMETSRAVYNLTNNFKDLSKVQAMDMVAAGFQNGLNYADDYLDTLREYAPQFESLGYSAQQFYAVLAAGKAAGAWNLDKVADAVKEFNIRAKDGSKTTAEGFSVIGLNADIMSQTIAKGGNDGVQALNQTIQALRKIEDPVKRNQAGVALFGTCWEDLTEKVVLGMDVAAEAGDKTTGAMQNVIDVATTGDATAWTQFMRQIQDTSSAVGETLTPLIEKLTQVTTAAGNFTREHPAATRGLTTVATGLIAARLGFLGLKFGVNQARLTVNDLRLLTTKIRPTKVPAAIEAAAVKRAPITAAVKQAPAGIEAATSAVKQAPAAMEAAAAAAKQAPAAVRAPLTSVLTSGGGTSKVLQTLSKVSKVAGKLALPLAVATEVYDIAKSENKAAATVKSAGGLAGGLGGAKVGAAIGTAILPGIGTAVGGALGGLGGYLLGKFVAGKVVEPQAAAAAIDPRSTSFEAAEMGYEGALAAENAPLIDQMMAETAAIMASFNANLQNQATVVIARMDSVSEQTWNITGIATAFAANLQTRATDLIARMASWSDQTWNITTISTAFAVNLQSMSDNIITNGWRLAGALADAAARAAALPAISAPGTPVAAHAAGGIFSRPHLGWVAEAGWAESIIPIRPGNPQSIALLNQTAQMLGVTAEQSPKLPVLDQGGSPGGLFSELLGSLTGAGVTSKEGDINVTFAPVIHGAGPGIIPALERQQEKFADQLRGVLREQRRVAYVPG